MLLPSTELQVPIERATGSAPAVILGTSYSGYSIGSSVQGGLIGQPLRVPVDYDRSRDGFGYMVVFNPSGSVGPAAGNVLLRMSVTILSPQVPLLVTNVFNYLQAIPAAWPVSANLTVAFDGSAGPIVLPAGTLPPNSAFGLRFDRISADPSDTWIGALGLSAFIRLRYSRLCQHCDSCA